MRKILMIISVTLFTFSVAYATITANKETSIDNIDFQPSNNVYMFYASPDNQSFGLGSEHQAGDRSFGTSSGTTKIYYKSKTKGTVSNSLDVPANDNSTETNGWSSL
ncbi:hypothetical protein [Deferribacter abyssi]|uniref:hypothetical protein n=1 Tax=Deferribacter abyssi TaxID=213806 RepID=UPI003C2A9714